MNWFGTHPMTPIDWGLLSMALVAIALGLAVLIALIIEARKRKK